MGGNTVFQNTTQPPIQAGPVNPTPQVESQEPSFPIKGKIIKLSIGILLFVLFIYLIINFVIPRFGPKKEETVTLTYWGLWEDKQVMQNVISDFEKRNPNIKIDYIKQDPKEYRERLATRILNGTGPDIFRFHNTWFPMFSDMLLPMSSDTIKKEEFQNNFYTVIQKDLVKNGAIYGIPLEIDTLSLFVNTDSFKAAGVEVPKTWEEFAKTARSLTVKDENNNIKSAGAALGTFDNITHAPDIISLLLLQNSANLNNLNSTSQNAAEAFNFYISFVKENNVWDEKQDPSILAFAKGNLSMFFGYSWDIFIIKNANPNLNFAIYPVPHLPDKNISIASYWVEGVSLKSKHQRESLLFMKFISEKETEQKLFSEQAKTRLFGEPYARVDLAESLKDNPLLYPFIIQAKDAVSSFFASDTYDNGLNFKMNNYLGDAVRSVLGNTSAETAVEVLDKGINQVLQQYSKSTPVSN